MSNGLTQTIKRLLRQFDIEVTRFSALEQLRSDTQCVIDMNFLKALDQDKVGRAIALLDESRAQIRQDIFVLSELDFKQAGFFVEFGATDGVNLSNTYLLETKFSWKGILAEPALSWHEALHNNRNVDIAHDCVWGEDNATLEFVEPEAAGLSTISGFSDGDRFAAARKRDAKTYTVNTITLTSLLDRYAAPREIDYLSIDTEGSEFDILQAFDFDKYRIKVITCEHNHTRNRERVHNLLSSVGYTRKFEDVSQFDDWYVLAEPG